MFSHISSLHKGNLTHLFSDKNVNWISRHWRRYSFTRNESTESVEKIESSDNEIKSLMGQLLYLKISFLQYQQERLQQPILHSKRKTFAYRSGEWHQILCCFQRNGFSEKSSSTYFFYGFLPSPPSRSYSCDISV